jgi:hypothetical protein
MTYQERKTYRERKAILYRMIYFNAWANYVPTKTQALRDLIIQIDKLRRLAATDEFELLFKVDSDKKGRRLAFKNAKRIDPQYEKVLALVEKVFEEAETHAVKRPLTKLELKDKLYGSSGFITLAEEYGAEHAAK